MQLHQRCLSPKYRIAEKLAQSILDGYIKGREEITYRDLLQHIRERETPFNVPDITELVAKYLGENGVKVWR